MDAQSKEILAVLTVTRQFVENGHLLEAKRMMPKLSHLLEEAAGREIRSERRRLEGK